MAIYDAKPLIYEANNDGSYTYRWNIREVQMPSGGMDSKTTVLQWECNEVIVWGTVTRNKITEKVVTTLWNSDFEKKLINDFNAAKEGLFSDEESQKYIDAYKTFLSERKTVKEQVDSDCNTLKIQ